MDDIEAAAMSNSGHSQSRKSSGHHRHHHHHHDKSSEDPSGLNRSSHSKHKHHHHHKHSGRAKSPKRSASSKGSGIEELKDGEKRRLLEIEGGASSRQSQKHRHHHHHHHHSSQDHSGDLKHSSHSRKSEHKHHHHHHGDKEKHRNSSGRSKSPKRSKIDELKGHKREIEKSNSAQSFGSSSSWSFGSGDGDRWEEELKEGNEQRRLDSIRARSQSRPMSRHGSKRSSRREMMRSSRSNSSVSFGSAETFDETDQNKHNKQDIENQIRDLGEALILYEYAERAALRIQREFRKRQQEKALLNKQESGATEEESEDLKKGDDQDDNDESKDKSELYTQIFLAAFTIITVVPCLLMTCWKWISKLFGDDPTGGADAVANVATSGGGGPAGPTPTGGEGGGAAGGAGGAQAGAQGAMAAQAASSAASGAASGVASGAAAGAAASSAAAAATAGATAAAAGATQVATVVVVSTAAVAATTTAVVSNTIPEPILTTCGLANPDIRSGKMVMLFEGLPRPFDERESGLVESLVMQSYNEITLGTDPAVSGCLDPLAREMQSISIVNQTLSLGDDLLDPSTLEVVFEAEVSCDRCSDSSPLFSEEQVERRDDTEGGGNSTDPAGNTTNSTNDNTTDFDILPNATTEGVVVVDVEESRQLLSVDFSSQQFFQKLIQLVIMETEELSDEGELPEGFVQISKASVITTGTDDDEEQETMVTEIKYKRQASSSNGSGSRDKVMATFEFGYVDESGEVQKETVEVTEEGGAVPTTAFPTFKPSHEPSASPSSRPTAVFSGQPTTFPSVEPSRLPSSSPSQSPSDVPSVQPSSAPSLVPSLVPSDQPSAMPSSTPSDTPSAIPSDVPSDAPSSSPSDVPSSLPSFVPSDAPSYQPSDTPSYVPSDVPSESPSMQPSMVPSASPSKIPTSTPSSQPTATLLLSRGRPTSQSSDFHVGYAYQAVNGNYERNYNYAYGTHTQQQTDPWWQVYIGGPYTVKYVTIWNRSDCCWDRLYGAWIQLLNANGALLEERQVTSAIGSGGQTHYFSPTPGVYYVRVRLWGAGKILSIAELDAWGYPT